MCFAKPGGYAVNLEKKKAFLVHAAYYAVIAAVALAAVRYLLHPLLPFICGFIFAWFLHKPAAALGRKLHLHTRIPAFALTVVFYAIVFAGATVAGIQMISALEHFVPQIPTLYTKVIVPFISQNVAKLELWLMDVDPTIVDIIDRVSRELFTYLEKLISSVSVAAVRLVSGIVTGLPTAILSVILTVISTFFIAEDYDRVTEFLWKRLPEGSRSTVSQTVTTGLASLRKVLGSYILIMILSFVELSIGFLLLDVPYAVGAALIVAIIDIMPILGTGLVLIPWAIIAAVLGSYKMALGVALLYVVMLVVRNIVEPRLVGQQMGLHPLATLISMFVGLQLFGIVGLFGFPITLSLLLKLKKSSSAAKAA